MGTQAMDEGAMRQFGALIARLQQGGDLTRSEAREAYLEIWRATQPDLQQGALIALHRSKGATTDELVGMAESHDIIWSEAFPYTIDVGEPHLGIVGVGTDSLKSFNVSSAASIVVAACGVPVHKVGGPGMTGVSGSHEAFLDWGVDGLAPLERAVKAVGAVGIGFTTPMTPHLGALGIGRVISQLRFPTVIHIMGPIGCHSGERHKVVGVPEPAYVDRVANAMHALGYEAALVPCGTSDDAPGRYMDEFSNCGETLVAEVSPAGVKRYTLRPEDLGVKTRAYAEIESADSRAGNALMGARVLSGAGDDARTDLLAINAGACLKLMGRAGTYAAGTALALEAIRSGAAVAKLRALIQAQNEDPTAGLARLDALLAQPAK